MNWIVVKGVRHKMFWQASRGLWRVFSGDATRYGSRADAQTTAKTVGGRVEKLK